VKSDLEWMWDQAAVASFLYRPGIFQEQRRKATKMSVTSISLWALTSGVTNSLNSTATSFGRYVIMPNTIADAPLFGSLPHPPHRYPLTSASTHLISNNVTAFRFSFIYILYRETYFTDVSCPKVTRQIVEVWVISKTLYTNPDTSPALILVY
jgi:hypothetical protein